MDLTGRISTAMRVARAAGENLLDATDLRPREKGYHDFVTEMDFETERLIREALLSEYPSDGFYGEELGGDSRQHSRWIVDPIDGTSNFIHGIAQYAISIAYEREGEVLLGVVYAPAMGEMFSAAKGMGAYLNTEPIHVSGVRNLSEALVGMSFAHRNRAANERTMAILPALIRKANDFRRIGSAALDLCYVAAGRLDAFFELDLNLYDIAAGALIVREAGGIASGWPGEADCLETGNILSATPEIHKALVPFLAGRA